MTAQPLDADGVVVDALRRGNEVVLRHLVAEYRDSMLRTARGYVADASTGEDVVQDTWIAVLRGIDRFDERSSLRTWIFAILTNRAKTTGQRNGRSVPLSSLGLAPAARSGDPCSFLDAHPESAIGSARGVPGPEDVVVVAEQVQGVLDAIATLPAVHRAVITLRDVHGCTAVDVCARLGLSEGNQRVLLHRARAQVRRQLVSIDQVAHREPTS